MIRTIFVSSLLIVICNFIQSTWFGAIALWGVIPDLGLIILTWISYKNGPVEGPVTGFISGLAEDCISASPLGYHAFMKTFVAFLASLLHGSFYIDKIFLPFLLGAIATLAKGLVSILIALLFGWGNHPYDFGDRIIWIEAVYNGLLSPLIFLLLGLLKRLLITESNRE